MDRRSVFWLAVSFGVVAVVAMWGGFYSAESQKDWFAALQKPALYPSASVFPVAWSILYGLMAVAAWLVGQHSEREDRAQVAAALSVYGLQLALQTAWCYVFFFAQRFGWAALTLGILWVVCVLNVWAFFRVNRWAGVLLLPLMAWTTFAAYLSFGIAYYHSEFVRDVLRRLAA